MLLAGLTLAAEWGLTHEGSLGLTDKHYVQGNIFQNEKLLHNLSSLPSSSVESAKLLLQKRSLYERENIFPSSIIDYAMKMLMGENDEKMNERLSGLTADDRLYETRKIMHKDLLKH